MLRSGLIIIFTLLVSKILALLRESLLAFYYGASYIVDAYIIAISLPTVLFSMFASGISNSYIPISLQIHSEYKRKSFFKSIILIVLIISFVVSLFCYFYSYNIAMILAPGFKDKSLELTSSFIKVVSFYLPCFSVFNIFSAHLASVFDFAFSNFCNNIVTNFFICLSVYLSISNTLILMYGYVFSIVFVTFLLGFYLIKIDRRIFNAEIRLLDENVLKLVKSAIPLGFSVLTNQINGVVDRVFSSELGEGITSVLSYANRIQLMPYSLVISALVSIFVPKISKAFADDNLASAEYYTKKSINLVLFLSMPCFFFILLFSEDIVRILLQRGQFDINTTSMTSVALILYSVSIPFYSLREIATRVLSAKLFNKIILRNTLMSICFNILFNVIFVRYLGFKGLPIATSLSGILACLLMFCSIREKKLYTFCRADILELMKIFSSCVLSYIICISLYSLIESKLVYSLILMLFYFIIYILSSFIFKVEVSTYLLIKFKIIKK